MTRLIVIILFFTCLAGWCGEEALDLFEQGRFRKAIIEFEKDLADFPEDHETLNFLGACYYQLDIFTEAEDCFVNSLKIKPDYAYALINLTILYLDMEDEEKLWQVGAKLIECYPDRFYGYFASAYYLYKKERWPEAKRMIDGAYRKIGKKDPFLAEKDHDYLYLLLLELRKKIRNMN